MTHRNIVPEEYLEFVHDLRSPLTAIRNWAELMERDAKANYLKQLLKNVDRAEKLIASFLDAGTKSRRAQVSLREIVAEAIDEIFVGSAGRCAVQLDEDVRGVWDATKLRRAVVNLLDNAAKYSIADTPIHVRVAREGECAIFSIHNHLDSRERLAEDTIFDPFYRGDGALRTGVRGWGLGLSIVHKITREYQGTVAVEQPSAGEVRFTVRLPIRPEGSEPGP